jgi:hypothetical protein
MRNPHPSVEDIEHVMQITGMEYIQARNHLISRELSKQHDDERQAAQRTQPQIPLTLGVTRPTA